MAACSLPGPRAGFCLGDRTALWGTGRGRGDYKLWDQPSWSPGATPATPSSRAARRDSGHAWPELANQPGKRREPLWSQQARWTRAAFLPSARGLAQGSGWGQGKLIEQGGDTGQPGGEAAPVPRPSDSSASLAPLVTWCPGFSILPTPPPPLSGSLLRVSGTCCPDANIEHRLYLHAQGGHYTHSFERH